MRGLKPVRSNSLIAVRRSHLLQMRGLKHKRLDLKYILKMSHLLQMRGLKQGAAYAKTVAETVASFTDAWIETYMI